MDTTKFDAMLSMDDPDFATKLRDALGLKEGEPINIVTPQFNRTDGLQVPLPQLDFDKLPSMPVDTLKAIGCQKWDEPDKNGDVLWLFPAEWYNHIPEGYIVHGIWEGSEAFKKGVTDDDQRCGALAYGFKRKADLADELAA